MDFIGVPSYERQDVVHKKRCSPTTSVVGEAQASPATAAALDDQDDDDDYRDLREAVSMNDV